jgi:methionine sulfoxide reductase heme-binding subunit
MQSASRRDPVPFVQVLLVLLASVLALIVFHQYTHDTGDEEAIRAISRLSGQGTMALLLLTLAITPLRTWLRWHWLLRLRRTCGLLTFCYACLHVACFALLDHELDVQAMADAIIDKPGTGVGLVAFLLLLPLAVTSNRAALRRLGGRRWQELHRSLYAIALLAEVHYLWQADAHHLPVAVTAGLLLAVLLIERARARVDSYQRGTPSQKPGAQVMHFYKNKPPGDDR